MLTQRYSIDMVPGGVPLTLHVTQYDAGMTEFVFVPFASSGAIDLSVVTTARIEATKPDRLAVVNNCTYANGEATYVLQEQLTAKAGSVWSKLVLLDANNNVIASKAIVWEVDRPGVTDDATVSESDVPLLREAIEAAGRAATYADRAQATYDNFAEVVAEQVEQMQIHEGQTVIDGTLTVSGAAADAKATGDRIRAIETAFVSKAPIIINSASGDPATISDGADDLPFKSVAVNIAPVQSGTGDPSPTNVRPISGWTAVNVTRAGKNLCPTTTITLGNGSPKTAEVYFAKPLPIGTYTFSASVTINTAVSNQSGVQFISTSGTNIGSAIMAVGTTGTLTKTITVTDPILRLYFYLGTTDYNNGKTVVFENIQVEVGSTATPYEPYTAQTYSVTLPSSAGTVYGGTLDVVSGVLTVDRVGVDIGTLTWYRTTSYAHPVFYCLIDAKAASSHKAYCSMFSVLDNPTIFSAQGFADNAQDCQIASSAGNKQVYVRYDAITDAAAFKTAVTGQTLVYPIATPQTYQLTPTEVRTILGGNTLWADAGAVDVQYPADTKLYIEQLTKPTEDDMTANTAIQSGKFFMVGNRLFLSTAAIASGDTINPRTNCTELSLADALNNLN